ncbi:MAG: SGNH/GDSL hydrolase family protein [Planctomycetota bacterium]|nr:SGNH/GDSL hydrolase family protein [Planctomycetota bacterium]
MKIRFLFALVVLGFFPGREGGLLQAADKLELRSGDRIVLLGNTLIERAQIYGYLEAILVSGNPGLDLTFRNLGWSGDNVFGHSRAVFDAAPKGFGKLRKQVVEAKPTVLVIGYGSNAAYAGEAGLPAFIAGYTRLLDAVSETGARLALLSPVHLEKKKPPLPDPAAQNRNLEIYTAAISKIAAERKLLFVDLFSKLRAESPGEQLTGNGIHLNKLGYLRAGQLIAASLGAGPGTAELAIDAGKPSLVSAANARVEGLERKGAGLVFKLQRSSLPSFSGKGGIQEVLRVRGLRSGKYALRVDGAEVLQADASQWKAGVRIAGGPDFERIEKIRKLAVEKNFFYFHRYRPANWPYIYGFRRHEQGNNAVEIPLFDPLIKEKEAAIAALRSPVVRTYELARVKGGAK